MATGDAYFYSEEVLNLLLQDETAASLALPEVTATEATKVRRILRDNLAYLERRKTKPPFLDEEGCLGRVPGRFSERKDYLLRPEEYDVQARLPLAELVRRSKHAVVVEIVEVRPGLLSSVLESLVRVRVDEVLASFDGSLEVGDELVYRSEFFDLQLGSVRFCAKNPAYSFPKLGERAFLLLPSEDPILGLYNPYGEFRMTGSMIELHPYNFVLQEPASILLSDLRGELTR